MLARSDLLALCHIPEIWYVLLTVVCACFAFVFLYQSYRSLIKARAVQDTPTSKIRSAAQGYVELIGQQKICPQEVTHGRLSHEPCTWYRYKIEHYSRQNNAWYTLETGISSRLFCIDDDTGTCYIDPQGAEITTPLCDVWQGRVRYPRGKPKGFFAKLFSAWGAYRYTEFRMHAGMPLYVSGYFLTLNQKNIGPTQRSQTVETLVHNWQHQHTHVLHLLLPSVTRRKSSIDDSPESEKLSPTLNVISQYGLDSRQPFILSGHGQRRIIRSFKVDAFIWGLCFVIMSVLTLFLLHFKMVCY